MYRAWNYIPGAGKDGILKQARFYTQLLINFRYPDYYKILYSVVEGEREKCSYLTEIDLKRLDSKLTTLMTKEELFTDENLSLSHMAEKLNVSQHQFSQFLNEKKGKNFSSFINKYRMEKAKKMLIAHPDIKILAIAYDVGFKSKSTFNAAFSKFVRMTPHEFRNKYAK